MERRRSSSSRKQSSPTKSAYQNVSKDDIKKSKSIDPGTSKMDYTSMFSLTDPATIKKFQRESYTSDADEASSIEEITPIADDNEDQTFAEYGMPEKLLEPDDQAVLTYLKESAREKRGIVFDESDETETVKNKFKVASIVSKNEKTETTKKSENVKKLKNIDSSDVSESSVPLKDLKIAVDTTMESGPSSVASSIPSDSGKFKKKKDDNEELWKNYTVHQMINASFIVSVEPGKNVKEGPSCRLIMTKDHNGQPTEEARPLMTFTDYEFSSDSEPEEKGYYFRKLYRHNPNLKSTKTKIDELKEQVAPEKFIKRIRHAITYDTKDEIAKWRKPSRKPFPAFYYPVQFVVPERNPLQKLPKREYNKIRGFRPRSSSAIFFEQMEPAIRRTEREIKTRRRRSCSPSRRSAVHRFCHTMMTDFLLPDDRFERFDMTINPRRFKEGRFLEDVIVMWCDYYLKKIKRARRKGVKMTIPPLLKYTEPYPTWKLDEDCRNLVAAKKWPKCSPWQLDLIKVVSNILFPEEVHFMLKTEMMTYSGEIRRGAERLLNTFLQRELCTRNAMETLFALMLAKRNELQNVKYFPKRLAEMTSWIFKEGRIPFGFFDDILPKKFTPRQPMAACNYCPDAILAAIELFPSIVNIFQQDDVDVTAKYERRRRSKILKAPPGIEAPNILEKANTLVEAEQNSNQLNETAENVVKENKARKRGRKNLSGTRGKKQKVADIDSEELKESAPEPAKTSEIKYELSSKSNHTDIPAKEVIEPRSTSFSPELGFDDSSITSMIVQVGEGVEMDDLEDIDDFEESNQIPESSHKVSSEKLYTENISSDILREDDIRSKDQDIQQKSGEDMLTLQHSKKKSTVKIQYKLSVESLVAKPEVKVDNINISSKESSDTLNEKNYKVNEVSPGRCRKLKKKHPKNAIDMKDRDNKMDIQTTSSNMVVEEMENITIPERSSVSPILPFTELIMEHDAQEILPEEILIVNEPTPSQTDIVESKDWEPATKKRKLSSATASNVIHDESPPVSTKTSKATISKDKKANLSRDNQNKNDSGKSRKKGISDIFKLPFDFQENFFKDDKSKPDSQKGKGSSNKRGSQKAKEKSSSSTIFDPSIEKKSSRHKNRNISSETSSSTSEDMVVVNITETPSDSNDEVTIIGIPAIVGSYTVTCSSPPNSDIPVERNIPKLTKVHDKIEDDDSEVITSLYIDSEGNSRTLPPGYKIDTKLTCNDIMSNPDLLMVETRPPPLSEIAVLSEVEPPEVETKSVEEKISENTEKEISHEGSNSEENERKIFSLVASNSDLLLVLREGKDSEVLDYLTSLEAGNSLKTPSDVKPIPFSNVIGTPQCHSVKVTNIKYHHRIGKNEDYNLSSQNLNLADAYEVNNEKIIMYCRTIGEDIANCQAVKPYKSKYIFIWEHTSIGWILTKRLHNAIELSLKEPFNTESRILYDYSTSRSFKRAENESYIVYRFSLGDYLGTSGQLKSIDGYFTAYNGKMIILLSAEEIETSKVDWLPCISLITFSLGGQKISELMIDSYSKVFATEKPPVPLQVVDDPKKEKSLFIYKSDDRYCETEKSEELVDQLKGSFDETLKDQSRITTKELHQNSPVRVEETMPGFLPIQTSETDNNNEPLHICVSETMEVEANHDDQKAENKKPNVIEIESTVESKENETVLKNSEDDTVIKESAPTKADDTISYNNEIIPKLQEKIVTESIVSYNKVFSEFTIAERQPETIPTYTIITTTALTASEESASRINQPYKQLDSVKEMVAEKDILMPSSSISENGENIVHPVVHECTEAAEEGEVSLPEISNRPPIRINLPLAATSLSSNKVALSEFGNESNEESTPQLPKSQKRPKLHSRRKNKEPQNNQESSSEKIQEFSKEASSNPSMSEVNEEDKQLEDSTLINSESNSSQISIQKAAKKRKNKELPLERCYLFQRSSSDSDSPHNSRSPTPNSSITFKPKERKSTSSISERKERGICITAFFRKN